VPLKVLCTMKLKPSFSLHFVFSPPRFALENPFSKKDERRGSLKMLCATKSKMFKLVRGIRAPEGVMCNESKRSDFVALRISEVSPREPLFQAGEEEKLARVQCATKWRRLSYI
jgi:hypothetical protein